MIALSTAAKPGIFRANPCITENLIKSEVKMNLSNPLGTEV
jgi:hypothetical protein